MDLAFEDSRKLERFMFFSWALPWGCFRDEPVNRTSSEHAQFLVGKVDGLCCSDQARVEYSLTILVFTFLCVHAVCFGLNLNSSSRLPVPNLSCYRNLVLKLTRVIARRHGFGLSRGRRRTALGRLPEFGEYLNGQLLAMVRTFLTFH